MAPQARPKPAVKKPAAKPKPQAKPKAAAPAEPDATPEDAAPAEAAPKAAPKKRNMRPKMPVFYEDVEGGTLMELGTYLGHTAEEVLSDYLGKLDDEEREQAHAAENYAVFTPDEGVVKLRIVPPTEPSIERR